MRIAFIVLITLILGGSALGFAYGLLIRDDTERQNNISTQRKKSMDGLLIPSSNP